MLLAGPNFGCGSSRETAVWSLMEAGIRCVIAPSFGDIFHDNSFQNGCCRCAWRWRRSSVSPRRWGVPTPPK